MHTPIYIRNLFTTTLLFFSSILSAQNLKKINNADTLYFYFKKTHDKEIKGVFIKNENCVNKSYVYKLTDSTKPGVNLSFFFDCETEKTIKKNKNYLKKKRKTLINYNFYIKNKTQLLKELYTKRPKFIIDQDEIKDDKIILREVIFMEIFNKSPIE